jgi:YVTN family beta-propeller protein
LGVGYNPRTGLIYVSNSADGTVSVISGSQVQTTIAVGNGPNGIDVDTSANLIYVANFNDATVTVIDGATNTVVALPSVGNGPFGVAYLPGTPFTFVTNSQDGSISWLENGTLRGTAPLPHGGFPYGIAADPARNRVLIANFTLNTVEVFDVATFSFGPSWSGNALGGPYGIAVDPPTGTVYVANSNGNTVSVFTSAGNPAASPIAVGAEPRWVAIYSGVSPSHVFVSNRLDGTVSAISGASVYATLTVGVAPIGIGINAATGTIYVANTGVFNNPSNQVTVIQDSPPATATSTATQTSTSTPTRTPTPTSTPTSTPTPFPTPAILGLTPVAKPEGAPGFTLKIIGTGFYSDTATSLESTARWNGADRTTLYISPTLLYADILTLDLSSAGIANVTVLNPEAGLSNPAPFTVQSPTPTPSPTGTPSPTPIPTSTNTPNPLPQVLAIAPVSGTVGTRQVTLAVNGTNFIDLPHVPAQSSVVRWNGQSLTTLPISSTLLFAQLGAAQLDAAGVFSVTVFNPGNPSGGGTSNAVPFTVVAPTPTPTPSGPIPTSTPTATPPVGPAPQITGAQPPSRLAGPGGASIQLGGQNFLPQSVARWNGAARTTLYVSATTLVMQLNAGDLQTTAPSAEITVVNPGGQVSNVLTYPIIQPTATATPSPTPTLAPGQPTPTPTATVPPNPVPQITSFDPPSSPVEAGGAHVVVNGTGFIQSSVVNVDGTPRETRFFSASEVIVTFTPGDLSVPGTLDVQVVNPGPGGGASSIVPYPVTAVPQDYFVPAAPLRVSLVSDS